MKISRKSAWITFALALAVSANAQSVSITGTVVDSATSAAISGATVKLVEYPAITATTSSTGTFTLSGTPTAITTSRSPVHNATPVSLVGNTLTVGDLGQATKLSVDVFACNGSRMHHAEQMVAAKTEIRNLWQTPGFYYVKVSAGENTYMLSTSGTIKALSLASPSRSLGKTTVTYTIEVTAGAYNKKDAAFNAATGDVGTIRLAKLVEQAGVWTNVTPSGVNLSTDFGVQDAIADPAHPGVFFLFVCMQGVYKSTDWGVSWTHVDTDGKLEHGRPWGDAIAPDGSYMLASSGYPDNGNQGAWKSTDGGVTWTPYNIAGSYNDPYNFDIDPLNKNHVITVMHSQSDVWESTDAGQTWVDKGDAGNGGSSYCFFVTSTTWLDVGQDGGSVGTRLTTNSGASWTTVGPMQHAHGNAQIYIDPSNSYIYAGGHANGVQRSTDHGASFTEVSSTRATTVWGTGTKIYAMDPGANASGTAPMPQSALRSNGASWTAFTVPSGMNNGAKRAAAAYNSATGHWVIVTGNWNAGAWRYVEP